MLFKTVPYDLCNILRDSAKLLYVIQVWKDMKVRKLTKKIFVAKISFKIKLKAKFHIFF